MWIIKSFDNLRYEQHCILITDKKVIPLEIAKAFTQNASTTLGYLMNRQAFSHNVVYSGLSFSLRVSRWNECHRKHTPPLAPQCEWVWAQWNESCEMESIVQCAHIVYVSLSIFSVDCWIRRTTRFLVRAFSLWPLSVLCVKYSDAFGNAM